MEIIEVNDPKTCREFIRFPARLYRNEKNWIRPLDKDIEEVFDPKKNPTFRNGEAIRWLLADNRKTIGRVAAFINGRTAHTFDQPTGGLGFFECINDKEASRRLFDQCKEWLEERGMEAMDGPINFGERDQWWGLMIDGFSEPVYRMAYNFGYYKDLFEDYGFLEYFKQYTYHRLVHEGGLAERMIEKADRVLANPDFEFRHGCKKDLRKCAEDMRHVYNLAWANREGVKEFSSKQAMALFNSLKPVIDERLLWYGYHKGEPVSFFLMLPDVNQIFKYVHGKLDLIGKLKFLYHKKMKTCKKIFGVVFGIVPQHQGKGLEAAIVKSFSKLAWSKDFHYEFIELNWIPDNNRKMMSVAENVGGKIYKTYVTYRKLFDESREFKKALKVN